MKVNNTKFDVIVIGAGPVGSAVAEALAQDSLRVALLEEHPRVGLPNHCSGLVSPRTLQLSGVAEGMVGLAQYSSARVWGPGGGSLWLCSNSVQAIAIDRPLFDQILADRAVDAGATLMLGTQARCFERIDGGVQVEARVNERVLRLRAPLLIGADGASSRVARWMNRKHRCEIIPAAKADIIFRDHGTDSIEIFVGNSIAPGWFGWIIPLHNGLARIGIGARRAAGRYFEAFLDLIRRKFGDLVVQGRRRAVLPLGPARDFVADHVMLVGAAARQTKPTTGGGIYFGIRAAQLAAATAIRALERGDCSRQTLAEYERAWQRAGGRELVYGSWLRKFFRALPDSGLNLLIGLLGKPWVQRRISSLGDMDYPSRLFVPLTTIGGSRSEAPRSVKAGQRISLGA